MRRENTMSTDLITDQEIAFAHLVLSGTMTDCQAAEAAGLNPNTAAYTKSKPRVRDYMTAHRAAVEEKLVNQEAEGLRSLNLGRDQILARLWQLANLNPDQTRGSIAGQVKALSMIIAIEGLIADRRPSSASVPAELRPVAAPLHVPEATQAAPGGPEASPTPASKAPPSGLDQIGLNKAAIYTETAPAAFGRVYDATMYPAGPLRLSIPPLKSFRSAETRKKVEIY
jgi:hypothetical protein